VRTPSASEPRAAATALALAALAVALVVAATALGHRAPAPEPAGAPAGLFSAERARAIEARLLGDGRPHPVGTDANRAVRDRVLEELARAGVHAEVQRAVGCSRLGACAWVDNVVARLDGAEPPSVLLAAHYDGVPAGPGASDDGAGVAAVIEVARALALDARPRHPVVILVDDGEERGLLGADAFAREHPFAREVAFAVNLEARGTRGPSTLFETGGDDAWLLSLARGALDRPVTTSLLYEVYRRLPNDTDFTVFRERLHARGFNLAYFDGPTQYHTPRDDLGNASPASLQHHGAQALALVRALAAADLAAAPRGDAAWFDLFGRALVSWPLGATLPLALAALGVLALAAVRARARLSLAALVLGALVPFVLPVAGALAGVGLGRLLACAGALPAPFVARPLAAELALAVGGFACVALAGLGARRLASPASLGAGLVLGFALQAVLLAHLAPRVAYLALAPALAGALGLLLLPAPRRDRARLAIVPVAAALVAAPLLLDLGAGIGLGAPAAQGAVAAWFACGFVPLLAEPRRAARAVAAVLAAAMLVATAVAARTPPFDEASPQRVNLAHLEDATTHEARWIADASWGSMPWGDVPPALVAALGPAARREPRAPWDATLWLAAPAPWLGRAAPWLDVTERGPGVVRGRLRSGRGAPSLRVHAANDAGLASMRLEGAVRAPASSRGFRTWAFDGVPPEGLAVEIERAPGRPLALVLEDRAYGLPAEARALAEARGRAAAPSQDGDLDVVRASVVVP
jgi:hypothetical protein